MLEQALQLRHSRETTIQISGVLFLPKEHSLNKQTNKQTNTWKAKKEMVGVLACKDS